MTILYFAYGSNMFTPRLRFRINTCEPVGTATLAGHELRFHKRSKDGSGKCNAFAVANADALVRGVLFELPDADLAKLHSVEGRGHGYNDHQVTVTGPDGTKASALTYLAADSAIDETLKPFGWYWDFVSSGAAEHRLPVEYVERFINGVQWVTDPDSANDAEERSKILGGTK
jgi:hypothetical protein